MAADLSAFLTKLGDREPPLVLRVSATLLKHNADERARDLAMAAAATIEAGLPRDDAPAFRTRVDQLLR